MTKEEKQAELQRLLKIVNATFDYLTNRFGRMIVCDDVSTNEIIYNNQKVWAEKYFVELRLDKLQNLLSMFTTELKHPIDSEYAVYIKKNTGYDFDLWAENRKSTEKVLKRGKIVTEKERRDVSEMMDHFNEANEDLKKLKILRGLSADFDKRKGNMNTGFSEVVSETMELIETIEKDGAIVEKFSGTSTVTVTYWDGPKPSHYNTRNETAPDGKHKLTLTECTQGKHSSTTVSIDFVDTRVEFYHAIGIHPNINAFWKDNTTIVIETGKNYTTLAKYRKVENYGDVIAIEYIES